MAEEFELEEALVELDRIEQDLSRDASRNPKERPFHFLRTYDETSDTLLVHFYG